MPKKRFLLVTIVFIVTSACACFMTNLYDFAKGVETDYKKDPFRYASDVETYYIDVPYNLDTVAFSASVKKIHSKRKHFIVMPNGGPETDVAIYDAKFLNNIKDNEEAKALDQGRFFMNEKVF